MITTIRTETARTAYLARSYSARMARTCVECYVATLEAVTARHPLVVTPVLPVLAAMVTAALAAVTAEAARVAAARARKARKPAMNGRTLIGVEAGWLLLLSTVAVDGTKSPEVGTVKEWVDILQVLSTPRAVAAEEEEKEVADVRPWADEPSAHGREPRETWAQYGARRAAVKAAYRAALSG